jgi:hypothetical protein
MPAATAGFTTFSLHDAVACFSPHACRAVTDCAIEDQAIPYASAE